ncbi:hypothetical protein OBBRIDRAFT_801967 [Obba rivulosa]|uniref:C2H2-type domain-containing protein n=1 Tax=Obba rivulosa TaxID=1052685 RepID=A0A8E2J2I6_9APHY|nr:hypothetical protein OBBRIDRAFT_801967 [Obba rivulosa]
MAPSDYNHIIDPAITWFKSRASEGVRVSSEQLLPGMHPRIPNAAMKTLGENPSCLVNGYQTNIRFRYEEQLRDVSAPPPPADNEQGSHWNARSRTKSYIDRKQPAAWKFKHIQFGPHSTPQQSPGAASSTDDDECPECGKKLKRKGINAHVLRVHDKKEECPCPHCGRSFSQRYALKRHLDDNYCSALRSTPGSQSDAVLDEEMEVQSTP